MCLKLVLVAAFIFGLAEVENASEASTPQHIDQSEANKTTKSMAQNLKSNSTKGEKIKKLLPKQCGYQHSDDYPHTVDHTALNEFPWVALIEVRDPENPKYEPRNRLLRNQSGTLINARYVLTVERFVLLAVATVPIEQIGVWLGGYHPLNETECLEDARVYECNEPPQYFQVEKVIPQEYHSTVTVFGYIIALIRLRREVRYSDYIRPICLPLSGSRRPKIGDKVVESSSEKWKVGSTRSFGNGTKARYYLRFQNECANFDDYFIDHRDVICLPYSETNLRGHPAGGPLMSSYRSKWYQEGITVSRWHNENQTVGIYISVRYHINWILDNLEP